jgi:small-conductance mechanosensitive channel
MHWAISAGAVPISSILEDLQGFAVTAAVVLLGLIGGWLLGLIVRSLFQAIFKNRIDNLARAVGYKQIQQVLGLRFSLGTLFGFLIHLIVTLAVYVALASVYFPAATLAVLAVGAAYLPTLLVAAVILLVGLYLSQMLADVVYTAARAGMRTDAAMISAVVRFGVVLLTVSAALIELGVATLFVTTLLITTLAATALAAGLAIGLGGAEYVRDVLAGRTVRAQLKPGQRIEIDGIAGIVVECGPSTTLIATDDGKRTILPNRFVAEKTIVLG